MLSLALKVVLHFAKMTYCSSFKVSERGKITILHNLRFLNGLKGLKTIFRLKETPRKNIISFKSYNAKKIFCI